MISKEAQRSFKHIFKSAVLDNFSESTADSCDIESISDQEEITATNFSVLTITSSSFRFLILLHFDGNEETINFFGNSSTAVAKHNDNPVYLDRILEFCNLVCGSMNRKLHFHYSYSGMSTPYVLTRSCLDFISALEPGYVKHYRITINLSVVLHATLCVCNYGAVDFVIDTTKKDDIAGELEIF
jgi:hypothetical protein